MVQSSMGALFARDYTHLVEVNSDTSLPILAEMVVGDLLVVFDGHFDFLSCCVTPSAEMMSRRKIVVVVGWITS